MTSFLLLDFKLVDSCNIIEDRGEHHYWMKPTPGNDLKQINQKNDIQSIRILLLRFIFRTIYGVSKLIFGSFNLLFEIEVWFDNNIRKFLLSGGKCSTYKVKAAVFSTNIYYRKIHRYTYSLMPYNLVYTT